MEFLKPAWLWGILTLALPVIIHFWYQKRGQVIWWAASEWLGEKTSLKHRGIKLDEILLMLLRCLLLLLLVLILSQPALDFLRKDARQNRVHLVENNQAVIENFRFEIETALSKGEKVFLTGQEVAELKSLNSRPTGDETGLFLQKNIQAVSKRNEELHLYLSNDIRIASLPHVYVPAKYVVHYQDTNDKNYTVNYLNIGNGKGLFVDKTSGLLTVAPETEIVGNNKKSFSIHSGSIKALIDISDMQVGKTVEAALRSLEDVYQLTFDIKSGQGQAGSVFDIVISDDEPEAYRNQSLYIITGSLSNTKSQPNVIYMDDSLKVSSSEMVRSGRLPEWLGEQIVSHFNLDQRPRGMTTKEFGRGFSLAKADGLKTESSGKWLFPVFLLALFLERIIVFRKERRNG